MASQNPSPVNASGAVNSAANGPPPGINSSISSTKPLALSPQPPSTTCTTQQQVQPNNIEPLDKSSSNTLKRNPKMELSKTDLLKLLGYLEGELQARDIVIAALKSEKMKHLLTSRYLSGTSDPHAALARDVAIAGGVIGPEGNQIDQQVASLEALVTQQRKTQTRMTKVLKDAEIRHRTVIKELEEEKRKHEHDTAQGDDITYGLEKERTRLKKELELEKQEKKRLELELKKATDTLEEERNRQKQIVLLLLAERKKIIMKYIEERKRSEDLAQILSEEKVRIDSMAEGLEEESKKSLQMEAELEKQLAQFDMERQQYRQALAKEEKRAKDLEAELEKLKTDVETWKDSQTQGTPRGIGVTPPPPPAKPANLAAIPTLRPTSAPQNIKGAVLGTGTPMVSSKVVQPTATVSSVPVSGPTTGIARSVTPGQALRRVAYPVVTLPSSTVGESSTATVPEAQIPTVPVTSEKRPPVLPVSGNTTNTATPVKVLPPAGQSPGKLATGLYMTTAQAIPATAGNILTVKKPPITRGVPPPVPPNKPVVPPKKEAAYLRRPDSATSSSVPSADVAKTASAKAPGALQAQPTVAAVPTAHVNEEEVKPR